MTLCRCPLSIFCSRGTPHRDFYVIQTAKLTQFFGESDSDPVWNRGSAFCHMAFTPLFPNRIRVNFRFGKIERHTREVRWEW